MVGDGPAPGIVSSEPFRDTHNAQSVFFDCGNGADYGGYGPDSSEGLHKAFLENSCETVRRPELSSVNFRSLVLSGAVQPAGGPFSI